MLRVWRGRPGSAIPVLLVLAVLLAAALAFNLANLEPGSETVPPQAPAGSSPRAVLELNGTVVDLLLIIVGGLLLAGILYCLLVLRKLTKRVARARSRWRTLSSLLGLLLVLAVLLAWPRIARVGRAVNETTGSAASDSSQNGTGWAATAVSTPAGWLLLIIVLATMMATTVLLRHGIETFPAGRGVRTKEDLDRRDATKAVRTAIAELEIGADVRLAILGCFQRFCLLLGARGITEQEPLTPREIEDLAVVRLHVSRDASLTLTSLFEEARYSDHSLGETDRVRAIDSLAGIRAALEA